MLSLAGVDGVVEEVVGLLDSCMFLGSDLFVKKLVIGRAAFLFIRH